MREGKREDRRRKRKERTRESKRLTKLYIVSQINKVLLYITFQSIKFQLGLVYDELVNTFLTACNFDLHVLNS